MDNFAQILLKWYAINKRVLPWRDTTEPYKIWISEIILQQTRVDQGLNYYLKFIHNFPSINDLANANQHQVLKLWEGLGYYSRARNLHTTAQFIRDEYNGIFPSTYDDIIKLKGIGPYTAAAISSFSFNEKKAAVDGNVYRVLSRLFNESTPIDSTIGKKNFQTLADQLIDPTHPGDFNQAIMEFGATWCTPKKPKCDDCPFSKQCIGLQNDHVHLLPVKEKKIKHKIRYFHYFIFQSKGNILIINREKKDIWKGLFEFYNIESDKYQEINNLEKEKSFKNLINNQNYVIKKSFKEYKQTLSHQKIISNFFLVELEDISKLKKKYKFIKKDKLSDYAFPKTITMFLDDNYLYL